MCSGVSLKRLSNNARMPDSSGGVSWCALSSYVGSLSQKGEVQSRRPLDHGLTLRRKPRGTRACYKSERRTGGMQAVVSQDPRDTGKLGLLNPSLQRCNVPLCVEHTLDAVLAMAPFRVRGEQRSVPGVMSS